MFIYPLSIQLLFISFYTKMLFLAKIATFFYITCYLRHATCYSPFSILFQSGRNACRLRRQGVWGWEVTVAAVACNHSPVPRQRKNKFYRLEGSNFFWFSRPKFTIFLFANIFIRKFHFLAKIHKKLWKKFSLVAVVANLRKTGKNKRNNLIIGT